MRRTDEEFKQEVLYRSERYNQEKKKRLRTMAISCVPIVLCGAIFATGLSGRFRSKSETANGAPPQALEGEVEEKCMDCAQDVTMYIQITTTPGGDAWRIDDPQALLAILDGIQAFYDDEKTGRGGYDVGQAEGMSYTLAVTEGDECREYVLFHNALLTEEGWLVNPACYQSLEALICKWQ